MNKYKAYAEAVVNGYIVAGELVRLACRRYLRFFDKYDFRPEKVDRVIKVIESFRHFTGRHNNKNFLLLDYQKWILYSIFGFYHRGTNKRVTRYIYCELARKQGKTALAAVIALYMLFADEESGAEIELVANSRQQAKICFDMASNYLSSIDQKGKHFKRFRDKIKYEKSKSFLQVLSSDASGNDGYNSSCFVLDECHEQPDSKLWDVMCSSQGMRENPLAMIITTAGFNKHGFCYSYRQTCIEILNDLAQDDSQFAAIYTIDKEDSWKDEKVWLKSNPSLGATVHKDYLKLQTQKAQNNSSLEIGVKTKNLNMWCDTLETWISHDYLMKSTQNIDLKNFEQEIAYIGVDLSAVSDLTAVSVMIPKDDKFYFKTWYYLPESALKDNPNAELYKLWVHKGLLNITSGNVVDYDYITRDLQEISKQVLIHKIAYDSYNATSWAIQCESIGLPLEPFSQALWSFNRPTKEFERLIKSEKVIIDNNETTRYCFANVSLKYDHNNNVKPIKTQAFQKIDGVISMLQALGIYLEQPQYKQELFTI